MRSSGAAEGGAAGARAPQTTFRTIAWPLAGLGVLALPGGLWAAGLIRIGWPLAVLQPALPLAHGPLMVSGFLGTLINRERAVALGRRPKPYSSR